ncbi:MAG: hypothetical protein JXA35_10680 [Deltaproteobacteria bacterium]|nr:hypothetical protein [Deltaproteobacteria bacterium]
MKRTVMVAFLSVLVLAVLFSAEKSEGAKPNYSPWGNVRVKMIGGDNLTQEQKDFLQSTMDRLCDLGCEQTARDLNQHIRNGNVSFGKLKGGVTAKAGSKFFGYLDPRDNNLIINMDTFNQWTVAKKGLDKARKKGDEKGIKKHQNRIDMLQTAMSFTMVHEMVHMTQYCPASTPESEDPAYKSQLAAWEHFIKTCENDIKHIMNKKQQTKGDAEKLEWLVENTQMVVADYDVSVNSMFGKDGVIQEGCVTPGVFINIKAYKDAIVSRINNLLNDARWVLNDRGPKTSGIALPGSAGVKGLQDSPGVPLGSGAGSTKTPSDKKVAEENWDKIYEGWDKKYEGWNRIYEGWDKVYK